MGEPAGEADAEPVSKALLVADGLADGDPEGVAEDAPVDVAVAEEE